MTDQRPDVQADDVSAAARINRRRVLKTMGGAAATAGLVSGAASAHIDEGKGISWVAFCGCDGGFNIRYIRCNDEGELGAVAYDCDGGTVYYKAGHDIYRHEYTRRNEDSDPDNDIDWHVIEIDYAGTEDPVASTNPSDSRDPCGILNDSGGTKLEEQEIRAQAGDGCTGGSNDESTQQGDGNSPQRSRNSRANR